MSTIYEIPCVKGFIRMCNDGWLQGWHERNGGNLTYRMTGEDVAACRPYFDAEPREWVNMGVQADNLAGEYFITTGSGKFFRNVEPDPIHSIGIVEINDKGDSWRIVWGLADGARPTSEFPSHFMNHSVRKAATNGANRVIYHCHATNVIALTYILPLTDRDFSRALWQSATECPVVFPEGVGVCPWMVPGGADIAMATSEKMKTYQAAIWAQHGLFASGPDFDITFGLAHTIEKSAEIYVKVLSMGGGLIRQTITDDDLRAIAHDFGVTLNENFLYYHSGKNAPARTVWGVLLSLGPLCEGAPAAAGGGENCTAARNILGRASSPLIRPCGATFSPKGRRLQGFFFGI